MTGKLDSIVSNDGKLLRRHDYRTDKSIKPLTEQEREAMLAKGTCRHYSGCSEKGIHVYNYQQETMLCEKHLLAWNESWETDNYGIRFKKFNQSKEKESK